MEGWFDELAWERAAARNWQRGLLVAWAVACPGVFNNGWQRRRAQVGGARGAGGEPGCMACWDLAFCRSRMGREHVQLGGKVGEQKLVRAELMSKQWSSGHESSW